VEPAADDRIDELYSGPLGEFVARRDRLARELRTTDKDAAAAVKALRKPSRAAWAVNQAVRQSPNLLDEVVAAGDALRTAQERALREGASASLHDATRARQRAVRALADVAVGALGNTGEGARDAIEQTLTAASIDDTAASEVRGARLVQELEPPDIFAALDGAPSRAGARAPKAARGRPAPAPRQAPPAPAPARTVAARGKDDRVKQAELDARHARAEADAAQRAHDAAARRADALAQKAQAAIAAADDARRAVRSAAQKARDARRRLEQAERNAQAARTRDERDR
jgi:hypothetical protein